MPMEFKKVELSDKEIFDKYYNKYPQSSSYLSFVSLFTWQAQVNFRFAQIDGDIVIKFDSYKDKKEYYLLPETDEKTTKKVLDALLLKGDVLVSNLTKNQVEIIKKIYPDKFNFSHNVDSDNYIYNALEMATLPGKKFHSKKNFVNRFKKEYSYTYEKIDENISKECIELLDIWCENKDCNDASVKAEACACRLALKNMDKLSLIGGALRVDGKIVAFTLCEKYNSDMAIIHFEKADTIYRGAFQTIFYEFSNHELLKLKYINREEDMGDEGLRKAKLSYRPCFMLEMYGASLV